MWSEWTTLNFFQVTTKTLGVMEEDPVVSQPPSEDDIEDRIHDEFVQWKQETKDHGTL